MAAVPEPASEMMTYYSDNENDLFFEADGPKQTKFSYEKLDLDFLGEGSIQLKVSQQLCNSKFRKVVSVLVAVEKLRTVPRVCPRDFQGDDLKNLFFFIFAEEPIDRTCEDDYVCDVSLPSQRCRIRDINQKSLVLCGQHELHALYLQTWDMSQQVVFSMSYMPGGEDQKKPVALGIKEENLYLSCVMRDSPTLLLEKVDFDFSPDTMEKRFIFNKTKYKGKVEFESALYPNWYISTSQADSTPVFLGNSRGGKDITDFSLETVSP